MSEIGRILGIDTSFAADFPLLARNVATMQTERVLNRNIRALATIAEAASADNMRQTDMRTVCEVVRKMCSDSEELTTAELRTLAYNMVQLDTCPEALALAALLLRGKWRNIFIGGLVFSVLDAWNEMRPEHREMLCELIREKLVAYDGGIKKYRMLKDAVDYFADSGPLRMAKLISARGSDILDAASIIGYKASALSMSYFSGVIVNYFLGLLKNDNMALGAIEQVLSVHTMDRTKKLLFANLVEWAEQKGNPMMQTNVSQLASKYLGNISLASTWAPFAGATPEDIAKLRNAKELVNRWYARRIIEVFFEVCVQDTQRRDYWLRYVDKYVSDFRVVGSTLVKHNLKNDQRTSNMFLPYFISSGSEVSSTAALIMAVKDKIMIEFSDTGALYVYNHDNSIIQLVRKKVNVSIPSLKRPEINLLVDTQWAYPVGRRQGVYACA